MAMRREHKILQIFYLPDGTYTRTERITVLCVLVFGTLAANALFLSSLSKIQVPGLGTCDANACLGKPASCSRPGRGTRGRASRSCARWRSIGRPWLRDARGRPSSERAVAAADGREAGGF
jgi:hypothetical protein